MPKSQADYDYVEKLLRALPTRKELPWRLAFLSLADPHDRSAALDRRIAHLRLRLQPDPSEMAHILAEAGEIGLAICKLAARRPIKEAAVPDVRVTGLAA